MKKLLLWALILSPGLALTQTPPPAPASASDVLDGTATYKFVSPKALRDAGVSSPTNGLDVVASSNLSYRISATNNTTGNAATASYVTQSPLTNAVNSATGYMTTLIIGQLVDTNGNNPISVALTNQTWMYLDAQGDYVEDFLAQPPQYPWYHTNWGLSIGTPALDQAWTNQFQVTNAGYGSELQFNRQNSNEVVNFYLTRQSALPVTLFEAQVRTFDRTISTAAQIASAATNGGQMLMLLGNNPVGANSHPGPNLAGWLMHVSFSGNGFGFQLWTNNGTGSDWTNSPNGSGYVGDNELPYFTNGVSTIGIRRIARNKWLMYRGQKELVWECDGLTNINPTYTSFQRWNPLTDSALVREIAVQKLRVSTRGGYFESNQPKTNFFTVPASDFLTSAGARPTLVDITYLSTANALSYVGSMRAASSSTFSPSFGFPVSWANFGYGVTNIWARHLVLSTNNTTIRDYRQIFASTNDPALYFGTGGLGVYALADTVVGTAGKTNIAWTAWGNISLAPGNYTWAGRYGGGAWDLSVSDNVWYLAVEFMSVKY